jgi:hypothetical protein
MLLIDCDKWGEKIGQLRRFQESHIASFAKAAITVSGANSLNRPLEVAIVEAGRATP